VSIFEFDIFTRLFKPWISLLTTWKVLVTKHPGYAAFSTYEQINTRLKELIHKPGSFLFRLSCSKLGRWAIGYVTAQKKVRQVISDSIIEHLIHGCKVSNYSCYLFPNGLEAFFDIEAVISDDKAMRIMISKGDNNIYIDIDSTFELCKICRNNNKDQKLEPCGHLICLDCLRKWNKSCHFCRCEIKSADKIIIVKKY